MKTHGAASEHSMRSAFSRSVNDDLVALSAAHGTIRRIVCECSRRRCDELLDVTIKTQDDIERGLNLAFLGMIPRITNEDMVSPGAPQAVLSPGVADYIRSHRRYRRGVVPDSHFAIG